MRFVDEAKITVSAGHGGAGCVSFRRETFAPRGGPDGGEGGRGGDVLIKANAQLSTLQDLRFRREYRAKAGGHGSGNNRTGAAGESVVIQVPVGTIIRDVQTGEVLQDFQDDGQVWFACKGGRGGKGNSHFVSSTFQAPKFAQPGEEGESRELLIELRLLASVGIIGFPNAGKSTLISVLSAARPKIADYAFTTLVPNLGVVFVGEYQSYTIADIPGLIEGAHSGAGLGHRFLKHIDRTKLLLHLLDGAQILDDYSAPFSFPSESERIAFSVRRTVKRLQVIRNELGLFKSDLLQKNELVALNKTELLSGSPKLLTELRKAITLAIGEYRKKEIEEPFFISAATGQGLVELKQVLARKVLKNDNKKENMDFGRSL